MMTYFSYHTHSSYCDGKGEPEDYILKGIEYGLKAIGFSSHAPLAEDVVWAMKERDFEGYIADVNRLKSKYQDKIAIYRSLEIDYIPGVTKDFTYWKDLGNLDYTIGSVHLVKATSDKQSWFLDGPDTNYTQGLNQLFGGDIQKAVSAYYNQVIEMLQTQKPDVIGHVDKIKMNNKARFFREDEIWYRKLLSKTLEVISEMGTIVEVNTRGLYKQKSNDFFPDGFFLEECYRRNIPITIGTDAHHPGELLGCFKECENRLKSIGFKSLQVYTDQGWIKHDIKACSFEL